MSNDNISPQLHEYNSKITRHHKANFYIIALQQICFRLGWIFKTESIVIPALITSLTASPFILGLFPMVSRLGKFIPQLTAANFIEPLRKRKYALIVLNIGALGPWTIVTIWCWLKPENKNLFLWFFLFAYMAFWICTGAGNLAVRTIIGKVVRYNFRGRVIKIIGLYGGIFTVICSLTAAFMLKSILFPYNFAVLFTFSSIFFFLALICAMIIREPDYPVEAKRDKVNIYFISAFKLLFSDRNLRKIIFIGWTYSITAALFPFYTVYAIKDIGVPLNLLAFGLFFQHGANALGEIFLGPVADRKGNKSVLIILSLLAAIIPLLPLIINHLFIRSIGIYLFNSVFLMIGFGISRETYLQNYLLESSSLGKQPLYMGTVNLLVGISSLFPF
ncbi:MAG: MFS transporter, partial [bacterium]